MIKNKVFLLCILALMLLTTMSINAEQSEEAPQPLTVESYKQWLSTTRFIEMSGPAKAYPIVPPMPGTIDNAAFESLSKERQELLVSHLNDAELMNEVMSALIKGQTGSFADGDIVVTQETWVSNKALKQPRIIPEDFVIPKSNINEDRARTIQIKPEDIASHSSNISVNERLIDESELALLLQAKAEMDSLIQKVAETRTGSLWQKTVSSQHTAYWGGMPLIVARNYVIFVHDGSQVVTFLSGYANAQVGDPFIANFSWDTIDSGIDGANDAFHYAEVTYIIGSSSSSENWGVWGNAYFEGEW